MQGLLTGRDPRTVRCGGRVPKPISGDWQESRVQDSRRGSDAWIDQAGFRGSPSVTVSQ
jgi:hypothetical protein